MNRLNYKETCLTKMQLNSSKNKSNNQMNKKKKLYKRMKNNNEQMQMKQDVYVCYA